MDIAETPLEANRRELITFTIGAQDFCVDIMAVREIRGWAPATPLPHAPAYVRGVINLRGTVLSIVDLAARLGLPPIDPSARAVVIVAEIGRQTVGLLVDSVTGIVTVPPDAIQPTPDVASELARSFVKGVLALDGRLISLLTLDPVLAGGTDGATPGVAPRRAAA